MSDDAQEWRWVGEDGVQKTVQEQELIAKLSSESLANYTLVWKKGWLEWLPAMQVEELAWALPPGKADDAVRPREGDPATAPPAPPLYRYPVIKRRAASIRPERSPAARRPVVIPRPPDLNLASRMQSLLEPPTLAMREPALEHEGTRTGQARAEASTPVGSHAVEDVSFDSIEASNPTNARPLGEGDDEEEILEPEIDSDGDTASGFGGDRPFPRKAYGAEDDVATRVVPSRPPPPGPMYVGPHVPPQSGRPPPIHARPEPPPIYAQPEPPPIYVEPEPPPIYAQPEPPPIYAQPEPPSIYAQPEEVPYIPPPAPPPMDLSTLVGAPGDRDGRAAAEGRPRPIGLYVLLGLSLMAAVVVLLIRTGADGPAPGASASSMPAPKTGPRARSSQATRAEGPGLHAPALRPPRAPEPPLGKACAVVTQATKVADWADPLVAPSFAAIPGSSRVAVGIGQSDVYAIGMTIDPKTLDRDQVFREFRKAKLESVVPTAAGGKLKFQVSRTGQDLARARAVDAPKPFLIGGTDVAVARQVDVAAPEPIWVLPGANEITVPRVATVAGVGHAVTFRRGGKGGKVAVGWLDPNGRKRSELVDVRTSDDFVGTPSIAANESSILVAFASRGSVEAPWSITLTSAKLGALPKKTSRFSLPAGGPGRDAISPSIGALSGGRWLLQWTEGATGNRVVRVQVLGPDLTALTTPANLSPDGANAGQGAAWTSGTIAAVLFYVQNDKKSHELWGASVDCPR